jgi:hypothetical protein
MRSTWRREESTDGARQWIAPGTSLAFSVLMMFLGPLYARWFGHALPWFTQRFLAIYSLWIAIGCVALAIAVVGEQFPLAGRWRALLQVINVVLTLACILIVACGIVALFLPLLIRSEPT